MTPPNLRAIDGTAVARTTDADMPRHDAPMGTDAPQDADGVPM